MEGKGTLKLRKPKTDNIQHLHFENYELIHCEYSFHKRINKQGEIRSDVLSGNIRVALPMLPTDALMGWVFDGQKEWDGEISINDAHKEVLEKIYFEKGRCVAFRLHYEPSDNNRHVIILLTINAQRMIIGDVEYINTWN